MMESHGESNQVEGRNVSIWSGNMEVIGGQDNNLGTVEAEAELRRYEEKMDYKEIEKWQM